MLEKLKAALKTAGLSEELASKFNITQESEIEGVIKLLKPTQDGLDFSKVLTSEEFKAHVEKNGFDEIIKGTPLQSEHDKKVTAGINTFKEKHFKNIDPNNEPPSDPPKGGKDDETPEWAKALLQKVETLEKEKSQATKAEQAKSAMLKSKLPEPLKERWLNRLALESETPFEEQVKALEVEHDEVFSQLAGASYGQGLPNGGAQGGKPSDEELAEIADKIA